MGTKNRSIKITFMISSVFLLWALIMVAMSQNKKEENNTGFELKRENHNYYTVVSNSMEQVYDEEHSKYIYDNLQKLRKKTEFSFHNSLLVFNPFGTNECSFYMAFETEEPVFMEYTIRIDEVPEADFVQTAKLFSGGQISKSHEYRLIGFVPGKKNELTAKLLKQDGTLYDKMSVTISVPKTSKGNAVMLETTKGEDAGNLVNGLFTLFTTNTTKEANEGQDLLSYDNYGILRSIIPIDFYRAANIVSVGKDIFYAYSTNKYALVSPLGQVVKTYYSGSYTYHHDYIYNEALHQIWVLANDKENENGYVEDVLISIDVTSGEVEKILDFKEMFLDLSENAVAKQTEASGGKDTIDWIHLNSLFLVEDDVAIFSSRELSAILKISEIGTKPEIDYIIADDFLFEGTDAKSYLLKKNEDEKKFSSQYGQHDVQYFEDNSLSTGSYYLTMYNNNGGWSKSRPNLDYSHIKDIGLGPFQKSSDNVYSYYYKYLVNEKKRSYKLVDSFRLPYSGIVSNVQSIGNHFVTVSGTAKLFGEYDREGNVLKEFKIPRNSVTYRVRKYNL